MPLEQTIQQACLLKDDQVLCSCVDDRPGNLGFAVFDCPDRISVDELANHLNNMSFKVLFIEKEQRVEGAPIASDLNATSQEDKRCVANGRFMFPQIDPPNWGLDRCDQVAPPLDKVFNVEGGLNGCGVYLYLVDTGVNIEHEDFSGRILPGKDTTDSMNDPPYTDDTGHGREASKFWLIASTP